MKPGARVCSIALLEKLGPGLVVAHAHLRHRLRAVLGHSSALPPRSTLCRPALRGRVDPRHAIDKGHRKERLERWATLLDRDPHQLLGLLRRSSASGNDLSPLVPNPSAIDIAWNDPVFRVTGLKAFTREAFKAFFGLSNAELDRIISGPWRIAVRPAWQVAGRIRNVADPRPEKLLIAIVVTIVIVVVGIAQWLR